MISFHLLQIIRAWEISLKLRNLSISTTISGGKWLMLTDCIIFFASDIFTVFWRKTFGSFWSSWATCLYYLAKQDWKNNIYKLTHATPGFIIMQPFTGMHPFRSKLPDSKWELMRVVVWPKNYGNGHKNDFTVVSASQKCVWNSVISLILCIFVKHFMCSSDKILKDKCSCNFQVISEYKPHFVDVYSCVLLILKSQSLFSRW